MFCSLTEPVTGIKEYAMFMSQVLLLCLVAVAVADKTARIINYQYGIEEDGAYEAKYVLLSHAAHRRPA